MEPVIIHGRYEVIRRLAIGGMGEIFLARQTGIAGFKRLVILKTLRPELAETEGFLAQFLDEARVAATLNHPNIVAIYEVGVWEGVHFIAMEYIGGIDISMLQRETARARRRMPYRVVAGIVCNAAIGLDYAHHARDEGGKPLGIVHRDVSPQNLMIRPDGVVKVVDFGVAQASNQMHETAADKIKGKIRYMSPEQLSGEDLDGRSDEFSLGIVLWELVTGKPLFSQTNPVEVFQRIITGDVPKAREIAPDLPPALESVIDRMLAVSKKDRFARCNDVAHALRGYLDSSGGAVDAEVGTFVEQIAGTQIADRVRDLTPRAVSITASAVGASRVEAPSAPSIDTGAPTRVMKSEPSQPPVQSEPLVAPPVDRTATVQIPLPQSAASDEPPLEPSDALLSAVEQSGVLHGNRRLVTMLVGQMPGWSAVAAQLGNVPMGAFALSRLKNLMLRQLETIAREHMGSVVTKSTDSFVVAFGVDETRADDAERAVRCALGVKALLEDLGRDPRQRITAHMGISAGLCMVSSEDGPMQLGGAPVEAAEQLASIARATNRSVLSTQAIAKLCHDRIVSNALPIDQHTPPGVFEIVGPRAASAQTAERAAVKKILIADDADVFRKIEEEILRPFDFAFFHAKDGAQAVKLAVEHKPDLVLLDVQMPVMDGVQVLSFLKKNPATKDIPVVIITTIGRAHDEELLRKGGANEFLTKPVKPAALVAAVKKLLSIA